MKVNPTRQVPVLIDNSFIIADSNTDYIKEKKMKKKLCMKKDA